MSFLAAVACCLAPTGQADTATGTHPVVMELYTSQSCSMCPKANEQFADFAETHDVIALTFPVDYWDYLGWRDTFAKPAFSDRQRNYNAAMGRRGWAVLMH